MRPGNQNHGCSSSMRWHDKDRVLLDHLFLWTKHFPQPVCKQPDESTPRAPAHGSDPGVLKCREAPFAVALNNDEGLNRVPLWRRSCFPPRHRPSEHVHQNNVWAQETHALDVCNQPYPFEPLVEQWLMECDNLVATLEVRAVERDQMAVRGEGSGKSFATALFQPSIAGV
jgi:hypothetical protein